MLRIATGTHFQTALSGQTGHLYQSPHPTQENTLNIFSRQCYTVYTRNIHGSQTANFIICDNCSPLKGARWTEKGSEDLIHSSGVPYR